MNFSLELAPFVSLPRSEHLYVFFIQWSPDMYGEGVRGEGREPGFNVVKKNEESETADDEPITDINVKDWEVGQHSTIVQLVCSLLTLYVL